MQVDGLSNGGILQNYTLITNNAAQSTAEGGVGRSSVDTALFSTQSLGMARSSSTTPTFKATSVTTRVGNDEVNFNNSSGAVTWKGVKLDLSNIENGTTNLTIQKSGGGYNVYRSDGENYRLDSKGKEVLDETTGLNVGATNSSVLASSALFINNTGTLATGNDAKNVIINRAAGGSITGGTGGDQIFNFASTVGTITTGGGNDSIYSVGISAGTFDFGSTNTGDATLKLIGNMTGGTITMGNGSNDIQAGGYNIENVKITDGTTAASTRIIAKSLIADSTKEVELHSLDSYVEVGTFDASMSCSSTGLNALTATTVKGGNGKQISMAGSASLTAKNVETGVDVDMSTSTTSYIELTGNVTGATFALGTGTNDIIALGRKLDKVTITDESGSTTKIEAGSITGEDSNKSSITLAGGGGKNSIDVSGAIENTDIDTGAAEGYVSARSLKNTDITMDSSGTNEQLIEIKGNVVDSIITTGDGDDKVDIRGSVSGTRTEFNMGDGDDLVEIAGSVKGVAKIDMGTGNDEVDIKGAVTGTAADDIEITMSGTGSATLTLGSSAKNVKYVGSDDADILTLQGAVSDSTFDLGKGTNEFTAKRGNTRQSLTNVSIESSGTAAADATKIEAGAFRSTATGSASISLEGAGTNTLTLNSIAGAGQAISSRVTIIMGGTNTTAAQNVTIAGSMSNANFTGGKGNDILTIQGAVAESNFDLGTGTNELLVKRGNSLQSMTNVSIESSGTASTDATKVEAGAYRVTTKALAGTEAPTINLGGAGTNELTLNSITGKSDADRLNITMGTATGAAVQTLTVNGAASNLNVTMGGGADLLNFSGKVSNSDFDLGKGADKFTAENARNVMQALSNVNIKADAANTDGVTIKAGAYQMGKGVANSIALGKGTNVITLSSIANNGTASSLDIFMGGSNAATVTNASTAQSLTVNGKMSNTNVYTGNGGDTINVTGAVTNSKFNTGSGADTINITSSVTGSEFKFGQGTTSLHVENAKGVGQTMTNVTIEGVTNAGAIEIVGGTFRNTGTNAASISLKSDATHSVTLGAVTGNSSKNGTNTVDITLGTTSSTSAQSLTTRAASYLNYKGGKGNDDLKVMGALSNSIIDLGDGTNTLYVTNDGLAGGKGMNITNTLIKATEASSSNTIVAGAYAAGKDNGENLTLGGGTNSVTFKSLTGYKNGTVAVSMGLTTTNQQKLTIEGAVKGLGYTGNKGNDQVTIRGALSNSNINLGESLAGGSNTLTVSKDGSATGGMSITNTLITASGTSTNTEIIAGAYTAGKDNGDTLTLGGGSNSVTFKSIAGYKNGTVALTMGGTSASAQTLNVFGTVKGLTYTGGNGVDNITITNTVTDSEFKMGKGANAFTAAKDGRGQTLNAVRFEAGDGSTNTITYGKTNPGKTTITSDFGASSTVTPIQLPS